MSCSHFEQILPITASQKLNFIYQEPKSPNAEALMEKTSPNTVRAVPSFPVPALSRVPGFPHALPPPWDGGGW